MNSNVLNTDLSGKVAVVTGAGGILCSYVCNTREVQLAPSHWLKLCFLGLYSISSHILYRIPACT